MSEDIEKVIESTEKKVRKNTALLKNPQLLKYIIREVQEEGVIGEEDSIITIVLKICLRLVKGATATSSNILVSDYTGGGKDHLCKNICKVLLENEVTIFHRTDLSEKVLNYWECEGKEGELLSWDGKVIYLEDPGENVIASQGFKVRTSGGNAITVLREQKPVTIIIEGKPVFIVTSMKTSLDVEATRRWDSINIDLGKDLTKAVLNHVVAVAAGLREYKPNESFREGLRQLKTVEVIIPFAPKLAGYMIEHVAMRTQVLKMLDYIKASAALHQYQRKKDSKGRLIATEDDYEYARFAFTHLRNMEGQALNKQEQRLVDYLRMQGQPVKFATITEDLGDITDMWIRRKHENLVERRLITVVERFDGNAGREVSHLLYCGMDSPSEFPVTKKIFNTKQDGYLSSGLFYKEVNKLRINTNLKPIFKEMK